MGEFTELDTAALRARAGRALEAAVAIGRLRWPGAESVDLAGAALAAMAAPDAVGTAAAALAAQLRGWAVSAGHTAGALEAADTHAAARLTGT